MYTIYIVGTYTKYTEDFRISNGISIDTEIIIKHLKRYVQDTYIHSLDKIQDKWNVLK